MSDTKTDLVEKVATMFANCMVTEDDLGDDTHLNIEANKAARAAIATVLDGITDLTAEMSEAKHQACIGLKWPGRPEEMQRMIDTEEWQAMLAAKRKELGL